MTEGEGARDDREGPFGVTGKVAAVCWGWCCWRLWIPAPAFAGVTFFRRNDDVGVGKVVRQAHHEREAVGAIGGRPYGVGGGVSVCGL